jgi:putative transcriptional regulator
MAKPLDGCRKINEFALSGRFQDAYRATDAQPASHGLGSPTPSVPMLEICSYSSPTPCRPLSATIRASRRGQPGRRRGQMRFPASQSLHLVEQGEVFIPRERGCFEIVADHKNRDFPVSRDHDRASNARLDVGPVASFLPVKSVTRRNKNGLNRPLRLRGELRHRCAYTSARALRCSTLLHVGARHSPRTRRYPASSSTSRKVPWSAAVERNSRTASSTAWRALSGVGPELATSKGMACAMNWPSSRQIRTVYSSFTLLKVSRSGGEGQASMESLKALFQFNLGKSAKGSARRTEDSFGSRAAICGNAVTPLPAFGKKTLASIRRCRIDYGIQRKELKMSTAGEKMIKSAKQALAFAEGKAFRDCKVHIPDAIDVRRICGKLSMSQSEFAEHFGLKLDTVQDWEQGRRVPDGAARAFLIVIDREPEAVHRALTLA